MKLTEQTKTILTVLGVVGLMFLIGMIFPTLGILPLILIVVGGGILVMWVIGAVVRWRA